MLCMILTLCLKGVICQVQHSTYTLCIGRHISYSAQCLHPVYRTSCIFLHSVKRTSYILLSTILALYLQDVIHLAKHNSCTLSIGRHTSCLAQFLHFFYGKSYILLSIILAPCLQDVIHFAKHNSCPLSIGRHAFC